MFSPPNLQTSDFGNQTMRRNEMRKTQAKIIKTLGYLSVMTAMCSRLSSERSWFYDANLRKKFDISSNSYQSLFTSLLSVSAVLVLLFPFIFYLVLLVSTFDQPC